MIAFFVLWYHVFSNQITQCQLSQTFGNGTGFIDNNNHSINSFTFANNASFGILIHSDLNMQACVSCVDLTSDVCSDYIGLCPKISFLLSTIEPFVAIVNYRNASGTYKNNKFYLQFR